MKIILSPTKKMRLDLLDHHSLSQPIYLAKTEMLLKTLRQLSYDDLKKLLACNAQLALLNYERFQEMDLHKGGQAALLSYEGIAFQYMAPQVFNEAEERYINEHLRILSGFYGILRPFDRIQPYRLEMQARLVVGKCRHLYEFWKDDLYQALTKDDHVILNLASKEYSRCISKYLQPQDCIIDVVFGEYVDGKVKEKGVYVKMARGEMVRYMATNNITDLSKIKHFSGLGFCFEPSLSNERLYVFVKGEK